MKKHVFGLLLLAPAATLAEGQYSVIEAPVVGVEPLVRTVTQRIPHESCWDERVRVVERGRGHSATPGILGAVVGGTVAGALGHNSRHQPVIAGAGALLGASVGHDVGHRRSERSYYVTEQRCEVDYELRDVEEVTGYRISYRYGGNIYHTHSSRHPGDTIRVRIQLQPLD
mgnify:CR=1 FL=1